MSIAQVGLASGPEAGLPTISQIVGAKSHHLSLHALSRLVEQALGNLSIPLKPLKPVGLKPLSDFIRLYTTRLPDPLEPQRGEIDYIVVVACGEWTQARSDTFIAAMSAFRVHKGLPLFQLYSPQPLPPEISFLFGTMLAGVFEITSWDAMEEDNPSGQDCIELASVGRDLVSDLYGAELEADDLQWLTVVDQLVVEELRWCIDDPQGRMPSDIDYVPHAALTILGCIAGEAIRLNHQQELLWLDGEGSNWPRLGRQGSMMSLPVFDTLFQRFESGQAADLWDDYEVFYTASRLSPPVSMGQEINPLDFLPDWDPSAELSLEQAAEEFARVVADTELQLASHPIAPTGELEGFIRAYTCEHDGNIYDLFLCVSPWTDDRANAFLNNYGHRSLEDWELGMSPVFVFFSAHNLTAVLDYCFVTGPPIAPLEGLARVETPLPSVPEDIAGIENIALWLLDALERYSTIGLELMNPSLVPGLEFFLREDLRHDEEEELELPEKSGEEPTAVLVAVGMAVGASKRLHEPDLYDWSFQGGAHPVMHRTHEGQEPETIDWVEQARAIWRKEADEFTFPKS